MVASTICDDDHKKALLGAVVLLFAAIDLTSHATPVFWSPFQVERMPPPSKWSRPNQR